MALKQKITKLLNSEEKKPLIVGIDRGENKIPILCPKFPDCDDCKIRFRCWTNKQPEFTLDELKNAGIIGR
ncbi:MAG: hypothetical protein IMY88_03080 [Chloroflexi bacterium]|nr:hypothetical protein [Chloroflexota bacterium]